MLNLALTRPRHPNRAPGAAVVDPARAQAIREYAQDFAAQGATPADLERAHPAAVAATGSPVLQELADVIRAAALTELAQTYSY